MGQICMLCGDTVGQGDGINDSRDTEHVACARESDRRIEAGECIMCGEEMDEGSKDQAHKDCNERGTYMGY